MKNDRFKFETVWTRNGFDGECLVDVQRLEVSDTLSVFFFQDGLKRR
jgi:hypothetical protein